MYGSVLQSWLVLREEMTTASMDIVSLQVDQCGSSRMSSSHPEIDHLRLQEALCGDHPVFSVFQFSEIAAHQISDASHTMLLSQSICISIVSKMYEQYSYGITRNIRTRGSSRTLGDPPWGLSLCQGSPPRTSRRSRESGKEKVLEVPREGPENLGRRRVPEVRDTERK